MSLCQFTPLALIDIRGIRSYIARDNPLNALAWIEKVETHCRHLAINPGIGRRRTELGEAVRSSNFGRYAIFYRPAKTGIHFLRVPHQSRDLRPLSSSDEPV